jgi:hypothetical protein
MLEAGNLDLPARSTTKFLIWCDISAVIYPQVTRNSF